MPAPTPAEPPPDGLDAFVRGLPKAELHVHVEGTLEPELLFDMARRNGVGLHYADVEALRRAYVFADLQAFLDIYYEGCAVLMTEQDFYDLTAAYLDRAADQGVRHVELFFDPQTHTERGVAFDTVIIGIHRALEDRGEGRGVTWGLIPCFLRHLSEASARATLDQVLEYRHWVVAVGLDSSEVGNPPAKFERVFDEARAAGLRTVAHAGEEGPPDYIRQALDLLGVSRVDHGVRCLGDEELVRRLAADQVPLTVCPLSNVVLGGFPSIADHPLPELVERGLLATVNSDDPAYFGGYVGDNFAAVAGRLSRADLVQLARNSFDASFLGDDDRQVHVAALERYLSGTG